MYKTEKHSKSHQNVRFRRWSRKGYAIFNSLSHNVTIGKVCSSICNIALRKSSNINFDKIVDHITEKKLDENEDEIIKSAVNWFDILFLAAFNIKTQKLSMPGSYYQYIQFIHFIMRLI